MMILKYASLFYITKPSMMHFII